MKVRYIGANCRTGTSEKTGRPYSIAEVSFLVPDSHGEKKAPDGTVIWRYVGHGERVQSVPLDPSKLSDFADVKPGSQVELMLEPVPENPSRNQVVGVAAI